MGTRVETRRLSSDGAAELDLYTPYRGARGRRRRRWRWPAPRTRAAPKRAQGRKEEETKKRRLWFVPSCRSRRTASTLHPHRQQARAVRQGEAPRSRDRRWCHRGGEPPRGFHRLPTQATLAGGFGRSILRTVVRIHRGVRGVKEV